MNTVKVRGITSGVKISEVINENPYILLLLEYFEINDTFQEKTIADICKEKNIGEGVFISFINLYNGIDPVSIEKITYDDIEIIVSFLKNSHRYYLDEKFPVISGLINKLNGSSDKKAFLMVDKFFKEYYEEVIQHLKYEDETAFPYVKELLAGKISGKCKSSYTIDDYRKHHDDIEEKLVDLKNILLKYFRVENDRALKRKLLLNLYELDYDLKIHTKIEEQVLIPLVEKFEKHITE